MAKLANQKYATVVSHASRTSSYFLSNVLFATHLHFTLNIVHILFNKELLQSGKMLYEPASYFFY